MPRRRGADLVAGSGGVFGDRVELLHHRQDHVGPVADEQPPVQVDPGAIQALQFLEHLGRVEHHAVADDDLHVRAEDSGRDVVQRMALARR